MNTPTSAPRPLPYALPCARLSAPRSALQSARSLSRELTLTLTLTLTLHLTASATPPAGVTPLPQGAPPTASAATPCAQYTPPLPFGGAADAAVSVEEARRWLRLREARERERLEEAFTPEAVARRYRLERAPLEAGCVSPRDLIDAGRALFLRRFTRAEGFGRTQAPTSAPELQRLAARPTKLLGGASGSPDAGACVDCHWKGGAAGAGDRVDNAYLHGDGERLSLSEPRNPLALWGSGWVELIAEEMSEDLARVRDDAVARAVAAGEAVEVELESKGTRFGRLTARPDGSFDTSGVEGVDADLVVRPFGWRGVFRDLTDFVTHSAQRHFSLQPEALVGAEDADGDGVARELTDGQIAALVAYLATLDSPVLEVPREGIFKSPPFVGEPARTPASELALRWQRGAALFEDLGCAGCHTPLMPLRRTTYTLLRGAGGAPALTLDLSAYAAAPRPDRDEEGVVWVPVFSDFKRHDMGPRLAGLAPERGVSPREYLTRRLWGSAQTAPYLHTGEALTLDEVVLAHASEGSEALFAAEGYLELGEGSRSSLRVFLQSLSRAPAIRVR